MPIPRKNQNEFFIPPINQLIFEQDNNQAVIYQFEDDYHPSVSVFRLVNLAREEYNELATIVRNNFVYMAHIHLIFLSENLQRNFISEMMKILYDTQNTDNSVSFESLRTSPIYTGFEEFLMSFLGRTLANDLISLTYELYFDMDGNDTVQNLLGAELHANLRKNIINHYYKLSFEKKEKDLKMFRKKLYKQFKEFKSYQHYFNKTAKYQTRNKINIKNYFQSIYKNRQALCYLCFI
ncbi:hypothetical protein M9Y10_045335 [Tritrichomonas musculus]|uniref:Uncharacterized protein n=1 Tax=Tritrichomonas musculus TaxID=1915356 RepID=A0ABR2JW58_9EUKA